MGEGSDLPGSEGKLGPSIAFCIASWIHLLGCHLGLHRPQPRIVTCPSPNQCSSMTPPRSKAPSLKPRPPSLLPLWVRDAGVNRLEEGTHTFHLCRSPPGPPQENHWMWTFGHQTLQLVSAVGTGPQVLSANKWAFHQKSATASWDMPGARWT